MYRLGFFAFAALSALALAFGPIAAGAAETYKISGPHSHENLSIYFVHGQSAPGPVPLTLAEALKDGTVEVIETGSVRRLEIENRGDREVFLQMGDIVKGGRQDRVLARSLLLPPRSGRVNIGAYCVESGRWSRRGGEDALRFASALRMLPSRDAKLALAAPPNSDLQDDRRAAQADASRAAGSDALLWAEAEESRRAAAEAVRRADGLASPSADQQRITDLAIARRSRALRRRSTRRRVARRRRSSRQGEIWSRVAETQNKLSAALGSRVAALQSPSSLQLALENEKLNKKIDSYVGALQAKADGGADIIGYVFAVNGWINSGDVYPSGGLFKKMWPKLLKAAATEAIGETTKKADAPPPVETVSAFLKDAETGKIQQQRTFEDVELETRSTSAVIYNASRRRVRRAKPGAAPAFEALLGTAVHRNYIARR